MLKHLTALAVVIAALVALTASAQAHLVRPVQRHDSRAHHLRVAEKNLAHTEYVCARGKGKIKREHCRGEHWLDKVVRQYSPPLFSAVSWVTRQINAATVIGSESGGDPWPNCPDPYDGGGSWQATVNCENNGSWYDSPGYYRCGLQFDPMWENRFGRLCP